MDGGGDSHRGSTRHPEVPGDSSRRPESSEEGYPPRDPGARREGNFTQPGRWVSNADTVTPPLDVGGSSTPPAGGNLTSSAITTFNLLPLANPVLKLPVGGAYVGEGMPPVPAKLAARIWRWEYVEMGELLPEFWIGSKAEEGELKIRTRQGRKVSDIFTWLQSYGLYVAVLCPSEPQVIPELMA